MKLTQKQVEWLEDTVGAVFVVGFPLVMFVLLDAIVG